MSKRKGGKGGKTTAVDRMSDAAFDQLLQAESPEYRSAVITEATRKKEEAMLATKINKASTTFKALLQTGSYEGLPGSTMPKEITSILSPFPSEVRPRVMGSLLPHLLAHTKAQINALSEGLSVVPPLARSGLHEKYQDTSKAIDDLIKSSPQVLQGDLREAWSAKKSAWFEEAEVVEAVHADSKGIQELSIDLPPAPDYAHDSNSMEDFGAAPEDIDYSAAFGEAPPDILEREDSSPAPSTDISDADSPRSTASPSSVLSSSEIDRVTSSPEMIEIEASLREVLSAPERAAPVAINPQTVRAGGNRSSGRA